MTKILGLLHLAADEIVIGILSNNVEEMFILQSLEKTRHCNTFAASRLLCCGHRFKQIRRNEGLVDNVWQT